PYHHGRSGRSSLRGSPWLAAHAVRKAQGLQKCACGNSFKRSRQRTTVLSGALDTPPSAGYQSLLLLGRPQASLTLQVVCCATNPTLCAYPSAAPRVRNRIGRGTVGSEVRSRPTDTSGSSRRIRVNPLPLASSTHAGRESSS